MPPKRKGASDPAAAKKLRVASVDGDATEAEEPSKPDATLLSLIDDCLFSIFDRLPLSDLCSIGQTCKRLHQVSSEHFVHRHGSKVLIAEEALKFGNLIKGPKGEEYIDVFTASLQNVTLGKKLSSTAALERLVKFYETNKMAPIKNLRIESWVSGLMEEHGRAIAEMVNEVESFTLSNSKVVGDLHECILQHLPKMNRLTLWKKEKINAEMDYEWLQNPYPNLQHFAWHTNDQLPIDLIRFFFEINPCVTFFSLQSQTQVTLQQLIEQNIHVNELFFTMSADANAFEDLQQLAVKQGTRLHLKFPDGEARTMLAQNMAQFTQLAPYIDGLYFELDEITDALAQTLTTFGKLKVLQLDILEGAKILANISTLQEVYAYWGIESQDFDEYRQSMMAYASRVPNLKRIFVRNNSRKFEQFKFDEFDAARKRLAGAGKLKIHVRTDELYYMGALNDIRRDYDMVEIERVESEDVINPLADEYLFAEKLNLKLERVET